MSAHVPAEISPHYAEARAGLWRSVGQAMLTEHAYETDRQRWLACLRDLIADSELAERVSLDEAQNTSRVYLVLAAAIEHITREAKRP